MQRLDVKRVQIVEGLQWCGGCAGQGQLSVRDVMTSAPTCIASSTSVLDVVLMLHAMEFRHLLVTDARGKLLGLVSDRDVLRCFGSPGSYPNQEVLAGISAAEIMSGDLLTTQPDAPLLQAVTNMLTHGISCLPVLADERLVGILTSTDLHAVLEVLLQTSNASQTEQPVVSLPAERLAELAGRHTAK